jgi:hypothetical protein
LIALLLLGACAADATDDHAVSPSEGRGLDAGGAGDPDRRGDEPPREVACTDQSIGTLMLREEPAPPALEDRSENSDRFITAIDATAGGLETPYSYVYARFTDDGLRQVDLSDEDAFESTDWDVAFRRYVIRLNSGVAGPGEVTAARTAPMTDFGALADEPDELEYRTEEYFSDACDFVSDGSGIGAPATALASFWSYAGCLAMTGNVYVIALADGRHVKLEVLQYYTSENQQACNDTGMVPMPSGGGNLLVQWAFLD